MIAAIEGEIFKKEPTKVFIKCYGLIYEVNISLNSSAKLMGKEAFLHIKEVIREDARELYGFVTREEKEIFERVTKISGIGAKTALAILSTFTPEQFLAALSAKDQQVIQKVPGIGAKSAGRILVELEGFVATTSEPVQGSHGEAMEALLGLGFKKEEIAKLLTGIEATETGEIIKEALKKIKR